MSLIIWGFARNIGHRIFQLLKRIVMNYLSTHNIFGLSLIIFVDNLKVPIPLTKNIGIFNFFGTQERELIDLFGNKSINFVTAYMHNILN